MANRIPIFTHTANHNKWPKVYGFIAHLLCFQKPVLFYTFTFFLTCSVFGTFFLPLPICPFAFIFHYFFLIYFFLYQKIIIIIIIILVLFFSFYFWLNNSFSHMKRLRLVDYFVWLFVLFCFLSWICRVIIHNFITFLPFPKGLQFSSFIFVLT